MYSLAMTEDIVIKEYWNLVHWFTEKFSLSGDAQGVTIIVGVLLCIFVPYLLGSINPAILISRLVYHDDIRNHGSGNAGTTNMLRTYGKKAALCTLLLDFGKAIIATLLGRLIFGVDGAALAGFFVGFGHMFPIYYRFHGGKGVACFAMVALVIHPLVFLGILAVFLIVVIGTRYVSLASVMAALMLPLFMRAFANDGLNVAMAVMAACFVVFMHRENLKRIWENKESKLDFSKLKTKKKVKGEKVPEQPSSDTEKNDSDKENSHEQ